jgi:hypothetical protein
MKTLFDALFRMKGMRRGMPTMVAVACLLSHAAAADQVAAFSSLPTGDELEMTFSTDGCFHSALYELRFSRSPGANVSIVQVQFEWSEKLKSVVSTKRVTLGDLTLSEADVRGLDNLLQFYRSARHNGCTTVEKLSIAQRHDGKITAREQFIDGSCSYERKDLTRIAELVARLQKPK